MSHCLVTLKSPTTKRKKQHKVAFTESSSEPFGSISSNHGSVLSHEKCHSLTNSLSGPADVERLYNGHLLDLVCNVCTLCLEEISQKNSVVHINLLSCLIPDFTSTKLLKALNKTGEHSSMSLDDDDYSILCERFLQHTLFPWIKLSGKQFLSSEQSVGDVFTDSKSVDCFITIFCGIIRTLPVERQEELVSKSLQVSGC